MLTRALVAGLLAGYGVAIPIGAIAPLLISLAARTSLRISVAAALGVATVDGGYALVTVLGGNALAEPIRHVATPMRWAAAAALAVIAIRTALSALRETGPAPSADRMNTPVRAYLALIALTALNPTTVVYFGALAAAQQVTEPTADAVFVPAVFVASASWQLLLACGGKLLGRVLNTPRGRLVTALVASAVILVLAIRLAW